MRWRLAVLGVFAATGGSVAAVFALAWAGVALLAGGPGRPELETIAVVEVAAAGLGALAGVALLALARAVETLTRRTVVESPLRLAALAAVVAAAVCALVPPLDSWFGAIPVLLTAGAAVLTARHLRGRPE